MESCAAHIKDLGLPAIEEAQLLYEQKQLEERSLAIRLNHIRQGPLEAIRRLSQLVQSYSHQLVQSYSHQLVQSYFTNHDFDFGADAAVDGCDALGDLMAVPGSVVSSEEATSNFDLDDEVSFQLHESTQPQIPAGVLLLSVRLFRFRKL